MRRSLGLVVSAFVLVAGGNLAFAHDYTANAQLTLEYHKDTGGWFGGTVTTSSPFCANHRKIVLRKRGPDGSVVIGKTETNGSGFYIVQKKKTPGPYYSVAPRKVRKEGGHKHVCKMAISNEVGKQTW